MRLMEMGQSTSSAQDMVTLTRLCLHEMQKYQKLEGKVQVVGPIVSHNLSLLKTALRHGES